MKLPESINVNTYLAYTAPDNLESDRKIKGEDFNWDANHPKTLVSLCIEKLSEDWKGSPNLQELISKDREFFLQTLNTEVPLQILVDNISSDIFWKRCYKSKWLDSPVVNDEKKWINVFMGRYYAEYLENLNPRQYDPEKITTLVKLCGPYIQSLHIRSLIPSDLPMQRIVSPEMADLVTSQNSNDKKVQPKLNEPISRDHISLNAALGSLNNLSELHITYQLRKIGVNYRRDQFQFTNNDSKNLARGLEKISSLKILRITRTDMTCQRVKYILRGLSDSQKLETLDFRHCKIGDEGMASIGKFISKHENLRHLLICDNLFGPTGAESISHALTHSSCGIRSLDLRLNTKLGSEGIAYIAVALARGCNLTSLNISGCGIKSTPLVKVWSATSAENPPTCGDLLARSIGLAKTPLRSLDISVNDIGSPSDNAIANAICLSYLVDVNLKRSGMSSLAMAIAESAASAQRLRREAEKGIRFRRSAGRLVHAQRVAKGMNINTDPVLLAQQLSARPSIVSVTSEDGIYCLQTQPLPSDFGFVPSLKSPLPSSRDSSITGPPTSRRSSHHVILDPVMEIRRSALVRRGSDGSLLQSRGTNTQRHIKIFVSDSNTDSD
ncbi:protein NLRC3 [Plutella xylostella]|uniref:protein NLRC3 n=1 Tax=Plutella xylostella TaxID=51655 RepID=UPI0020328D04|nr:protein NLRC3 [Plutella xylostella]